MSDVPSLGAEFDRDRVYPVLPLRDIVVFPGMIVPLFVGREKSVKALEEVMRDDKHILVVTQKNAQVTYGPRRSAFRRTTGSFARHGSTNA